MRTRLTRTNSTVVLFLVLTFVFLTLVWLITSQTQGQITTLQGQVTQAQTDKEILEKKLQELKITHALELKEKGVLLREDEVAEKVRKAYYQGRYESCVSVSLVVFNGSLNCNKVLSSEFGKGLHVDSSRNRVFRKMFDALWPELINVGGSQSQSLKKF